MLLIDLTHTSHTRARTGIQRVARALWRQLGPVATPVTRDPYLGGWRALEDWELANLSDSRGSEHRKSSWPARAKWRGRLRRALGRSARHTLDGEFTGLIEPELFGPRVAQDLSRAFAHVRGPRVALFYDAIPLRFPELTPQATVARFPAYLRELLMFDGIAAISEESREALVSYWHWLGVANHPPVIALPLGVDPPVNTPVAAAASFTNGDAAIEVLSVGTLEGRKNHVALLEACEQLWAAGARFTLRLIGHIESATGSAALAKVRALQAAGRSLRFDGPASDEAITSAYGRCAFTIYPSRAEGFGLPVIESLAHGKPCICSGRGALGEISRGGGCVPLDNVEPSALAGAIRQLLESPAERAHLGAAAAARRFKDWSVYTSELTAWLQSLPRRG